MHVLRMPYLEAVSQSEIARWAGTLLHHIFRLLLCKILNKKLHTLSKSTHPAQAMKDIVRLSNLTASCPEITCIRLDVHRRFLHCTGLHLW